MTGHQTYLDELLAAALDYAARGWPVFPLVPYTKRPACPAHTAASCNRSDPHCKGGHTSWEQRATRDPGRIRRAWSVRPYGIGIACGPAGLLVVDTDKAKPGTFAPKAWEGAGVRTGDAVLIRMAAGRRLPVTRTVATPSGGFHRYYQTPPDLQLGNTAGRLGWLVDTRGRGGYVVAPPSRLLQGRYSLVDGHLDPAPLPDWITRLLLNPYTTTQPAAGGQQAAPESPSAVNGVRKPTAFVAAALAGETAAIRGAHPGKRNHALFCAAVALGQLVGAGLVDEQTVRDLLLAACMDHVRDGAFTAGQADATITSGLTRGKTQPRTRNPRRVA